MKFAIVTKHSHLVFTYREPEEDEHEVVQNSGGNFEVAPVAEECAPEEDMRFGFARA